MTVHATTTAKGSTWDCSSVYSVYTGMRDVVKTSGGFCASGGPYVIAHQCSAADSRLLFIGILGMLVSGAIFAGFSAWADGPVMVPGLLMWAGLFGALGWNFLDLSGGGGGTGRGGFVICGVVFLAMAGGGLVPVVVLGLGWLRRGGAPAVPKDEFPMGPLVRAAAHVVTPAAGPLSIALTPAGPVGPTRIIIHPPSSDTP